MVRGEIRGSNENSDGPFSRTKEKKGKARVNPIRTLGFRQDLGEKDLESPSREAQQDLSPCVDLVSKISEGMHAPSDQRNQLDLSDFVPFTTVAGDHDGGRPTPNAGLCCARSTFVPDPVAQSSVKRYGFGNPELRYARRYLCKTSAADIAIGLDINIPIGLGIDSDIISGSLPKPLTGIERR